MKSFHVFWYGGCLSSTSLSSFLHSVERCHCTHIRLALNSSTSNPKLRCRLSGCRGVGVHSPASQSRHWRWNPLNFRRSFARTLPAYHRGLSGEKAEAAARPPFWRCGRRLRSSRPAGCNARRRLRRGPFRKAALFDRQPLRRVGGWICCRCKACRLGFCGRTSSCLFLHAGFCPRRDARCRRDAYLERRVVESRLKNSDCCKGFLVGS